MFGIYASFSPHFADQFAAKCVVNENK